MRAREGFSIPAQREANRNRANALGALVVAEFIERGASARSAQRPELQRMLAYVAEHRVDYVIVHKLDRLARNRADDVLLTEQIRAAGARLVSTTEPISDSPDGRLVHGIMAAIAEFYSHNLSLEVTKGMKQKVAQGGTVGRAPLGYRNVRLRDDHGREDATVETDPDRAGHITWAFDTYATGEISLAQLAEALTARGLTTRPMDGREPTTLAARSVRKILTNPYYKGIVRFNDLEQPGEHAPLTDPVTWAAVQDMLKARTNGTRSRVHDHYLKGTLRCYLCGRQLIVHRAKSKSGAVYEYFICSGTRGTPDRCPQPAIQIPEAERRVEAFWASVPVTDTFRMQVCDLVATRPTRELDEVHSRRHGLQAAIEAVRTKQSRLRETYEAGAIPPDIRDEMASQLNAELRHQRNELRTLRQVIVKQEEALTRLRADAYERPSDAYLAASPPLRRQLNQAIFDTIRIGKEPEQLDYELA